MSQPYIGQVTIFAFSFAPRNWAFCNGALIAISQNQALFSIVGTTYGGDGRVTFGLPNLQDQTVMSIGQGPGLSNYALGQTSGVAEVTLTQQQIPPHSHVASGMGAKAADFTLAPNQNYWMGAREAGGATDYMFAATPGTGQSFAGSVIGQAGSSIPHMNEQPYLGMNYCIALYGIFPSRN
jgi:microcystin-dependent protein